MQINDYIVLMKQGCKFIKYYEKKYDDNLNSINYKIKLRYHIFSFAQIAFALRDRLLNDFEQKKQIIVSFFEKDEKPAKTRVGILIKLCNEWKHKEGFNLKQIYTSLKKTGPFSAKATKPKQVLLDNHKYVQFELNSNNFEHCLTDIENFCKSNRFL